MKKSQKKNPGKLKLSKENGLVKLLENKVTSPKMQELRNMFESPNEDSIVAKKLNFKTKDVVPKKQAKKVETKSPEKPAHEPTHDPETQIADDELQNDREPDEDNIEESSIEEGDFAFEEPKETQASVELAENTSDKIAVENNTTGPVTPKEVHGESPIEPKALVTPEENPVRSQLPKSPSIYEDIPNTFDDTLEQNSFKSVTDDDSSFKSIEPVDLPTHGDEKAAFSAIPSEQYSILKSVDDVDATLNHSLDGANHVSSSDADLKALDDKHVSELSSRASEEHFTSFDNAHETLAALNLADESFVDTSKDESLNTVLPVSSKRSPETMLSPDLNDLNATSHVPQTLQSDKQIDLPIEIETSFPKETADSSSMKSASPLKTAHPANSPTKDYNHAENHSVEASNSFDFSPEVVAQHDLNSSPAENHSDAFDFSPKVVAQHSSPAENHSGASPQSQKVAQNYPSLESSTDELSFNLESSSVKRSIDEPTINHPASFEDLSLENTSKVPETVSESPLENSSRHISAFKESPNPFTEPVAEASITEPVAETSMTESISGSSIVDSSSPVSDNFNSSISSPHVSNPWDETAKLPSATPQPVSRSSIGLSPRLRSLVKTSSPSVALFSPKFGKPRSVSNSKRSSMVSSKFSSPGLTEISTSRPLELSPSIVSTVQSPTSWMPPSPTTRANTTSEMKKIYNDRTAYPANLNDLALPNYSINRKKFPSTPKFDTSKSIIFAVCLCDFNHLRGPEIEYWIDENGSVDINADEANKEILSSKWPLLPFQALPDGSHDFEETFSYFNVLYDEANQKSIDNICDTGAYENLKSYNSKNLISTSDLDRIIRHNRETDNPFNQDLISFNDNVSTLWGISCVRQIATEELVNKQDTFTRSSVNKSIVILTRQPIFGQLKEKLSIITKSFFLQKDFADKAILNILYDNLINLYQVGLPQDLSGQFHGGTNSILKENDFYLNLNIKEFVHKFKRNALVIFKTILLEKKVLFFSKNIEQLCKMQFALIALIPNLITNLNDCGSPYLNFNEFNLLKSLNLKTSNRYSLLSFLGLPLQLFGFSGVFIPYIPLQQLDDILQNEKINHYIIGTSNDLLLSQKDKYCDLFVNLDTDTVEFLQKPVQDVSFLSAPDKKFIDLVVKNVDHFSQDEQVEFNGSDDYIRLKFEDYLLGLISSIKYDKFLNKLGYQTILEKSQNFDSPRKPTKIINQSMLVPGIDIDNIGNFNIKFINQWLATSNYHTFDKFTDNEIFYVFDPLHFALTETFIKQYDEFYTFYNKSLLDSLNYLKTNVQTKLQNTSLIRGSDRPNSRGDSPINEVASVQSNNGVKHGMLESGSFSLDDVAALDSLNDEIEMRNKRNVKEEKQEEKGGWMSWSSWVKK